MAFMKIFACCLLLILAGLQYPLWVGKGSMRDVWRLEKQVATQELSVQKLSIRNKALTAEIADLKLGNEAIAEISRDQMGYISKGEIFYRIKE